MKKIISNLLSLILIISIIPNVLAADDNQNNREREVLDALGIMSVENDSEFVTRKEFFTGLLHMVLDSVDETQVQDILVSRGILFNKSDVLFAGDSDITYNDAVATVVDILGYEPIAQMNGGYPKGYIKVAQDIGILKGVDGSRTLSIDRDSLVKLFYNAIAVSPFVRPFKDEYVIGEVAEGETILSIERKIYEIQGIVEANQYTSLIEASGNYMDQITIDGQYYYINGTNAGELLGCFVNGYIQTNDDDDAKVIFLGVNEKKTTELTIQAEDVLSMSSDCRKLKYLREDSDSSSKTIKISPTVKVIYNGKFYDQYTNNDFILENGYLRLIDNDSDNVYDCIFINMYETMIVDYTTFDNEIYGKYSYSDALNYLKTEDQADNENIHYYLDNKEVKFSNIQEDDVLTIQRSKGSEDIMLNVYISRNVMTGRANSFDEKDGIIKIDGEEYGVTKAFCHELTSSGNISLSNNYSFYFDYFGNLAYVKLSSSTDYCLFYKIFESENDDSQYQIRYMNDNSEWITAPVAERVRYNDVTCASNVMYRDLENAKPQVMLIKQNEQGQVKYIATAVLGKKGDKTLTKNTEQEMSYHSSPAAFNYKLYLESNTKVFVIPDIPNADRDDYYVTTRKYFSSDRNYTITAYDVDDFNFTGIVSVSESQATRKGRVGYDIAVVTDVFESLDKDDTPVTMIKCSIGSYIFDYEVDSEANPKGLSKGSVIRIHLDKDKKRINNWKNVSDELSGLNDSMRDDNYFYGKVLANNPIEGKLKIECDGEEGFFRHNSSTSILIYDKTEKTCEVGTYKDLKPNSYIYMHTDFAVPREIVVIRE